MNSGKKEQSRAPGRRHSSARSSGNGPGASSDDLETVLAILRRWTRSSPDAAEAAALAQQMKVLRSSTDELEATNEALSKLNAELEARVRELEQTRNRLDGALAGFTRGGREAERSREDSEERLRLMADALPVLISYVDAEQRYQFNNAAYEEWFGESKESYRGRHVRELIGEAAYAVVRSHIEAALAGKRVAFTGQLSYRTGEARHVRIDYVPHQSRSGDVLGFYALITDLTAATQVQEQLRTRQAELAHVLRASTVAELTGGLAHEVSQPLTAIANCIEACTRYLRSGRVDPEKLLDLLEEAGVETTRASSILSHLRELLQKKEPQLEPIDGCELVRSVAHLLEHQLRRRGITLQLLLPSSPLRVRADRVQIEQVIMNLMNNAIESVVQAGGPRRELEVRLTTGADRTVQLSVSDTGIGLPPETERSLFEPFFTTKAHGLGMGLVISRSIIEAHGGSIVLQRRTDDARGVTARFTLPLDPAGQDSA